VIMSHIDPLWHALSKLRRGKYTECIAICDEVLASNPNDQVSQKLLRPLQSSSQNQLDAFTGSVDGKV
jgi:hypothetical protein